MTDRTRTRSALSPSSTAGYAVPSRDPTPQLRPLALRGTGGGPGQLDRMRRGHPRVAVGCRDLALAIGSARVEFVELDDERPSETAFREDLDALIAECFTDAENGVGGWSALGAALAEYYLSGHYLAEARFVSAPDAAPRRTASLDRLRLELYPIHASSVQAWVAAPPTWQRLAAVTQSTPTGYVEIPRERLIYLQHGGAPGEWEGVSILRPLVFIVERWISLLTSAERNSYFGAGVAKVTAPMAETPADRDRMLDTLEAWQSGAAPWLLMPPGYAVDLSYPGGAAGDPRSALEYLDAQIDNALGRALYSLGYSSRGSLALGEQVEAADGWQTTAQLDLLLADFGRRVGEWVARRIGYAGRIPTLRTIGEESKDTTARIAMLSQAVTSGLVSWSADDEARIREELDLAPVTVDPAPAPSTLTAEESHIPPKGVAEEAARALDWRREYGRGGTEVGVARARDLKNRRPVSLDTLKRMRAYFDRHEADKDGEGYRPGEDGYPSAGRIAWGLWGGDAGRRWAEDKIAGVELGEKVEVIGAAGVPFDSWRPLVGVECDVAWASNQAARAAMDRELVEEIDRIAKEHRIVIWNGLIDGWQPGEAAAIYDEYLPKYREAVQRYATKVGRAVDTWSADELRRQQRRGLPSVGPGVGAGPGEMPDADRVLERIGARIDISADEIANRVQGEVEQAWASGQARRDWSTRITPQGLSRSALSIGNALESEGRVAAASGSASSSLVVVEVVRTSVLDNNRCGVCADRDGTTYRFPEQRDEYEADPLPDPGCDGGASRCRCGWLVVWGRR